MKKPYIIGIAGGSASGKSTFADHLAEQLNDLKVKIFHMDDYFREESERPIILGILNGKYYIDDNHPFTLNLDKLHKDLKRAVLEYWDVILTSSRKSPSSNAKSVKWWVGTCPSQSGYKPRLTSCKLL